MVDGIIAAVETPTEAPAPTTFEEAKASVRTSLAALAPQPIAQPAPVDAAVPVAETSSVQADELPAVIDPASYDTAVPAPTETPDQAIARLTAELSALRAGPAPQPAPVQAPVPQVQEIAPPSQIQINQHAIQRISQDQYAQSIKAEFSGIQAEIGQLDEAAGRWVPGKLGVVETPYGYQIPDLDRRIATLRELVDPEKAKTAGLPPIDELDRSTYLGRIREMEAERNERVQRFELGKNHSDRLRTQFQQRFNAYAQEATQQYEAHQATVEHAAIVDAKAADLRSVWDVETSQALADERVDPKNKELVTRLVKIAKREGLVANVESVGIHVDPTDTRRIRYDRPAMRSFIRGVIKSEIGWVDAAHRVRSGEYARVTPQSVDAAIAAPRAAGAPSPALNTDPYANMKLQDRFEAMRNAARIRR